MTIFCVYGTLTASHLDSKECDLAVDGDPASLKPPLCTGEAGFVYTPAVGGQMRDRLFVFQKKRIHTIVIGPPDRVMWQRAF